jgi:hypothetical protein
VIPDAVNPNINVSLAAFPGKKQTVKTPHDWVSDFGLRHCIVLFQISTFLAAKSPRSPSTNNKKTELRVSPKSQLRQSLASDETPLKPPWQCWGGSREVVFPQVPTWWKDATATLFAETLETNVTLQAGI